MLPRDKAVLYADDSDDDRFLFQQTYKEVGVPNRLIMVDDGAKVIDYLSEAGEFSDRTKFPIAGLVILDLKMPRKSGLETLEWIRGVSSWPKLPVLMLTASLSPDDIDRSYELGINAFLVKPSSVEELTDMVVSIKTFWLRFNEFPSCVRQPKDVAPKS